jgi:hypothetical protein
VEAVSASGEHRITIPAPDSELERDMLEELGGREWGQHRPLPIIEAPEEA